MKTTLGYNHSTSNSSVSEGQRVVSSIGTTIALVSFAMLFVTLMMGFAIFRFTAPVWPPQGASKPALLIPSLSTLIIFLSSVAFNYFEKQPKERRKYFNVTILMAVFFLISQFLFWFNLHANGIFTSSGVFASILYSFTWIHAAHIVLAFFLLLWLAHKLEKSGIAPNQHLIKNIGLFWHFLGIVWLIMFVTIFVL